MEPFRIDIPETELDDLQRRLATARFPASAEGSRWAHGMDVDTLRSDVHDWLHECDWRARERRYNRYEQFRTTARPESKPISTTCDLQRPTPSPWRGSTGRWVRGSSSRR